MYRYVDTSTIFLTLPSLLPAIAVIRAVHVTMLDTITICRMTRYGPTPCTAVTQRDKIAVLQAESRCRVPQCNKQPEPGLINCLHTHDASPPAVQWLDNASKEQHIEDVPCIEEMEEPAALYLSMKQVQDLSTDIQISAWIAFPFRRSSQKTCSGR